MTEQRVALVTGANRGIGLEIARQLARLGLIVVLTGRDRDKVAAAGHRLASEGLETLAERLDVTDPASVERAVARVGARVGRLDVLVNNAAVAGDRHESLLAVDLYLLAATLDTNFYGPLRMARAAVPLMRAQGYGRIVNISSGRGSFTKLGAGGPCYRLSKTALNAMTVVLADELKDTNVLVNAMTPGWVRTRLGGMKAPRSTAEAADTAVWLATLPDSGPRGGFFKDREPFPW